jgi:hypothetical protein
LTQQLFGFAGDKASIAAVFGLGVSTSCFNRQPVILDADKYFDKVGQLETEKTDSTVNINQMPCPALLDALSGCFDQPREQKEIVLEKRVSRHLPVFRGNPQNDLQSTRRRRMLPDVAKLLVNGRFRNLAPFDVLDQSVGRSDESDVEGLFGLIPLATDHNPVTIAIRLGAGDHRGHGIPIQATDALEQIADLLVFEPQLRRILQVLVLASAAFAKVTAQRLDPFSRRLQYPHQPGPGKLLLDLGNFSFDHFADRDPSNETDKAIMPSNAFPAESNVAYR